MSTLKVNTIQNTSAAHSSTPEEIAQGRAKAWVNMNAEPAESIRDSFNVSSFTDNGTGDFVINFANALSSANYLVVNSASRGQDSGTDVCNWGGVHTQTVNGFGMGVFQTNSGFSSTISRSDLVEFLHIVVYGD
jgi:hypothetical protein